MLLGLEDVEQTAASDEAAAGSVGSGLKSCTGRKRRINRGSLRRICRGSSLSSTSTARPVPAARANCTGSAKIRASGWTLCRRSSGCSSPSGRNMPAGACEDGVVQAPAPARLIEGGMPTEATIAQVLVSKYADHLPLYRQAQIYARQGIVLDRSTLADWVGHAAWHLRPLHERLLTRLKELPRLFADETTAPVLDPGRGRTKTGQLWAYAADDRPWGGSIRRASPMSTHPIAKRSGRSPIWRASKASCRSTAMPATAS